YFQLVDYSKSYQDALIQVEKDNADIIVEIPSGFEKELIRNNESVIQIAANAISGQTAGLAVAYSNSILRDFNSAIRTEWIQQPRFPAMQTIEITSSNWFKIG